MAVEDTVQEALNKLDDYANQANDFVFDLRTLSAGWNFAWVIDQVPTASANLVFNPSTPAYLQTALASQPLRPYNFSGLLNVLMPSEPGAAPAIDIGEAAQVALPSFSDNPPALNLPASPTLNMPAVPVVPSLVDPSLPTKPNLTLPSAPTLMDVQFPEAPTITIPTFEEDFPQLQEILEPSNTFAYTDTPYADDLMTAVKSLLLNDVQNGGFGIDPTEEANLWNRERERVLREGTALEKATRAQEGSGLIFPPGALAARFDEARYNTSSKLAEVEREISIKRAELMRDLRQFCVEKSISVQELLIRDFGFRQERVFNAAKFAAELAVTIFDAKVRHQNAKIEAFRAYADAYRARVDALISVTNVYKTEVEAASAKAEFNRFQVDLYNAHLAGVESVVKLYQAEMQAAAIQADIERNKLAVYGEQIKAFTAQIEVQNTQAQFYETQVKGELAKMELYKTQVAAYEARIGAAQTEAQINQANLQGRIDSAKLELAAYETQIDVYKTRLAAELDKLKVMLETNQAEIELYRSRLQAYETAANIEQKVADTKVEVMKAQSQLAVENARMKVEVLREAMQQQVASAGAGGNIFSNLVGAASGLSSSMQIKEE